jgi:hypothetical protein
MDLIDDVWFNVLNALEDIDTPTNTTAFTDYVTTQWIEKYRTTSTQGCFSIWFECSERNNP